MLLRYDAGETRVWHVVHVPTPAEEDRRQVHRELLFLAGLTPTPYQSGESHREQGITKAGNRYVRAMAIEIAWAWLRYQPESALARWYTARFGHGSSRVRRIGIVALA